MKSSMIKVPSLIIASCMLLASSMLAQSSASQPFKPTELEKANVNSWVSAIREVLNGTDSKESVVLNLPDGMTYVRISDEAAGVAMAASSAHADQESNAALASEPVNSQWKVTGFVATEYVQGYPWRWVYAARITFTHKVTGQVVTRNISDDALLYFLPLNVGILTNFFNVPVTFTNLAYELFLTAAEYVVGDIFNQAYEQATGRIQYWEVMAASVLSDDYYWQAIDIYGWIQSVRPADI